MARLVWRFVTLQPTDRPPLSLLSVVIPCFNEEVVLAAMHERLSQAVADIDGFESELIFVVSLI